MSEITVTYGAFVRSLFQRSGDPSKDFAHAILGVVTEIHELLSATDEVNALEELGDLEFYLESLKQVVEDFSGSITVPVNLRSQIAELLEKAELQGPAPVIAEMCNTLLDLSKRWIGYGKVPDNLAAVWFNATNLVELANHTGPYYCSDLKRIRQANISKLMKRYKNAVFTKEAAINRDLTAERAALASA